MAVKVDSEINAAEAKAARRVEVIARLDEIDTLSIRPLRAKLTGSASKSDDDKLMALEAEAKELRKEL